MKFNLLGDYHTHSHYSGDSKASIEENVKQAICLGLKELAVTDHGIKHQANGISKADFFKQVEEVKAKIKETTEWSDRDSFISSYSIVNFNWDIYSLLPIIEANNRLNHSNSNYLSIGRNPQLRMFTDFNCEYAVANETKENPFWYPFTESAAFVVNEDKYDAKRRVVLTKCYYPHGAMNLFKCTVCAKHSYYLGDLTLKSVAEKLQYQNEKERLYNCPYCGNRITSFDFDILAQSNFKIRNSYLEEIRLSLTKELRDAKRLVFIGYSLPPDDVDYKTLYKSLNNVEEVYIILFSSDKRIENKFVPYAALPEEVQKTLNTFDEAFRNKKVLYNMKGVPEALDEYLRITVD